MATGTKATKATKSAGEKARDLGRVASANAQRTSAAAWREKSAGIEVEVPSGNMALLRRPGPEMFLRTGRIPDSLMPIVSEGIRSKQGLPPEKAASLMDDPKMLPQMMDMVDAAVVSACIQPVVRPDPACIRPSEEDSNVLCDKSGSDPIHLGRESTPGGHEFIPGDAIPEDERDPDFLYVSEVDFTDKMFIFHFALGGSADLERFRKEFEQSVASVDAVASNKE